MVLSILVRVANQKVFSLITQAKLGPMVNYVVKESHMWHFKYIEKYHLGSI